MGTPKQVGFCPHCCSRTPHRLVHTQRYADVLFNSDGSIADRDVPFTYYVAVCEGCDQILVYHEMDDVPRTGYVALQLLYPNDGNLHSSVPPRVQAIYGEAYRIRYLSPSAYATLIRRALEAITEDRGIATGTLASRLKQLSVRGEIPQVMTEMTEILRILGNVGAHAGTADVQPGHILVIEDFFRALVEYIYIGPSKVAEFRARLAKLSSSKAPPVTAKPGRNPSSE